VWGRPQRNVTASQVERGAPVGAGAQIVDRFAARLLETTSADAVIERVVDALLRSAALERLTARVAVVVEESAAVDALLDSKVARMLQALEQSDSLARLVEAHASRYLAQLQEHPEQIHALLQIQSRDAFAQFLDSIRARARAADESLDAFAHRMMKRA
jgi:hypothetical protein